MRELKFGKLEKEEVVTCNKVAARKDIIAKVDDFIRSGGVIQHLDPVLIPEMVVKNAGSGLLYNRGSLGDENAYRLHS